MHIYVSLLGFTALVFFSITGVTLNHPDWFGANTDQLTEHTGEMEPAWLRGRVPTSSDAPGRESKAGDGTDTLSEAEAEDPAAHFARLEIVEFLRSAHDIRGAVGEFRADDVECMIVFKGPGYAADVFIDRASGKYRISETKMGTIAIINDLHKGRDSGLVWSLIIDGTALLTIFVAVTGIVLLFYLKRKRVSGVVTAVVGTIALAVIYALWVP